MPRPSKLGEALHRGGDPQHVCGGYFVPALSFFGSLVGPLRHSAGVRATRRRRSISNSLSGLKRKPAPLTEGRRSASAECADRMPDRSRARAALRVCEVWCGRSVRGNGAMLTFNVAVLGLPGASFDGAGALAQHRHHAEVYEAAVRRFRSGGWRFWQRHAISISRRRREGRSCPERGPSGVPG
jgi:hypothetical protein